MLTFAAEKKRTTSSIRHRHAPAVCAMTHSRQFQQAKVRNILRNPHLQAKLTIGQPNDVYEQEADRVADQVMRMPEPGLQCQIEPEEEEETLQAKALSGQITPLVQRQVEPEEEEETIQAKLAKGVQVQREVEEPEEEEVPIQTKQVSTHTPASTPNLTFRIQSLKSGGQPLPKSAREFFEPRFGHDFSGVRVHTDTKAAESAKAVNAVAYTIGRDVVFGSGQYAPQTISGKQLLGHELAHVMQQGASRTLALQRQQEAGAEKYGA